MSAAPGSPVTVVVITRDRVADLRRTLGHLAADRGIDEVIVVDNGSTDGTAEAVRAEHPDVLLVSPGGNLAAAGRNLGVALAEHEVVAFADDDSWWADGALERASSVLREHPDIGLVAARILLGPDGLAEPLNDELASSPLDRSADAPGPEVLGFAACGAVVRRRAFLDAGGFEPLLGIGGEETLLALRLRDRGWRCVHDPAVVAHHWPSPARDRARRTRTVARNQLWTEWLARPAGEVAQRTWAWAWEHRRDVRARSAVADALRGVRLVLVRRDAVSRETAQQWSRLDRPVPIARSVATKVSTPHKSADALVPPDAPASRPAAACTRWDEASRTIAPF